ncbi:MAG: peptidoglycan binding protein CsiV, partial [Cellvibrionaceae bacterium]|nr:peptidoglycan binding protein CsiV [Cellvibrionaceae bacterium]
MTRLWQRRLVAPLFSGLLSSLLLGLSSLTLAQPNQRPETNPAKPAGSNWYQVELIVFKRLSINQIERPTLPSELQLAYPYRLKHLLADEDAALQQQAPSGAYDTGATLTADSFVRLLPPQTRQPSGVANALGRSRNQRVLFHQSWNQQLKGAKQAASIPISGGQQYDGHRELEGHIKLSLSRYLHLQSNLWLSRFAPSGQDQHGSWFELPQRPSLLPAPNQPQPQLAEAQFSHASLTELTPAAPSYHVQSLDRLKESRRMRSGEVHYLDHPAFGILIRLDLIAPP